MRERAEWGRLFRTVRHLRARQVFARIVFAGRRRAYRRWPRLARLRLDGPAQLSSAAASAIDAWLALKHADGLTPLQEARAAGAAERRFTFLNRTFGSMNGAVDWTAPTMSRLWQYQLHYTEYVRALALGARHGCASWAQAALELMEDWIGANPPGMDPGWEPYPLSVRVVEWTAALALLGDRGSAASRARVVDSLARQGRYLARHLEWHLGGNHLLKNAKALFVLGMAFECPEARDWRRRGGRLFLSEIGKQVLADGGHYERSPLYHGIVLEDVLDVVALSGSSPDRPLGKGEDVLRAVASRMASWLARMRHPDGGLALFNDGAIAGDPDPGRLLAYAERIVEFEAPRRRADALPESGYFILEHDQGRAVIDCGEVGPDELPAHAHADTLSYELCWAGRRLIVDSGTAEYAWDDLRRYVRSTAAHNTVRVDDVEQSEVWASHRVGRRARPLGARINVLDSSLTFSGAHDGYARLGVIHHRHMLASATAWIVVDELRGRGWHRYESYVHLHPDLTVSPDDGSWRLRSDRDEIALRPLGPIRGFETKGWYCPDWGRADGARVLTFRGEGEAPLVFGYVLAAPDVAIDLTLETNESGVVVRGRVQGESVRLRSDRCTFSS